MRETKFRAWDKDYKEMLDNIIIYQGEVYKNTMPVAVSPLNAELMQYTGLKDKNGKEIFEGDILSAKTRWSKGRDTGKVNAIGEPIKSTVWTVEYKIHKTEMGYFTYGLDRRWFKPLTQSRIFNAEAEVVGNIYENPELLVKTQ